MEYKKHDEIVHIFANELSCFLQDDVLVLTLVKQNVDAWISNLLFSLVWPTQESDVSFELKSVWRPQPYNLCDAEIISIPWHWMQSRSSDVFALQPSAEEVLKPLGGLFSWLVFSYSSEDHLSSLVVASDQSWEDNLPSSSPNTGTRVMKCPQGQMWASAFKYNGQM